MRTIKVTKYKKSEQNEFEDVPPIITEPRENVYQWRMPTTREQVHYLSARAIETIGVIKKIIREVGKIEKLQCLVFSINQQNAQHLVRLKNAGLIGEIELTCSTIKNRAENENVRSYKILLKENGIKMNFAYSHAKITLAKTAKDYFVVETSANLVNSAKYEQFVISNNKPLYDYYKRQIQRINDTSPV